MKQLAFIEWQKSYETGYDYIDRQHRLLVEIVNEFYEAVKQDRGSDIIYPILNRLVAYAEEHFSDEELAMEKAGSPKDMIEEHKKVHEDLVKTIFEVTQHVMSGKETTSEALAETGELLRKWLLEHILNEDLQFAPFLRRLKGPLR